MTFEGGTFLQNSVTDSKIWTEKGKGIREQAKEQVKKILAEHIPLPMDAAVEKELLSIVQEVEKRSLG
jgi:trimethylamine:corrinoid methyltransferase-like protein